MQKPRDYYPSFLDTTQIRQVDEFEKQIMAWFSLRDVKVRLIIYDWDGGYKWCAISEVNGDMWDIDIGVFEDGLSIRSNVDKDLSYISPNNSIGFVGQDFRYLDLSGYDVSYSDFYKCKFTEGSFQDSSNLHKTQFSECIFAEDDRNTQEAGA